MSKYTIQADVRISKQRRAYAVLAGVGIPAFWADTFMEALRHVIEEGEAEVTVTDEDLFVVLAIKSRGPTVNGRR